MHERMFADAYAPTCYITSKARRSYRTASHICLKHSTYFFLLFFIINTVMCVMNAYNNISWECDRLHYEEGAPPMKHTRLAILGIPT